MFKYFVNKYEEKSFRNHYLQTINTFYSNTSHYVMLTKDLSYPFKKHENGRPLEKYEELVVETMNLTDEIILIYDEDSISFFANVLYSETILMDKVNQSISKNVPMDHEVIKQSMNEILIGQKKAYKQYCNINTDSLKEELYISKTLRIRHEESRSELMEELKKEKIFLGDVQGVVVKDLGEDLEN